METFLLIKVEIVRRLNPYKPGVPFVGHRKTVQTQLRRRRTRRLIRVYTVYSQEFLSKLWQKCKPEDHWSYIAHLSAEGMLKSAIIEEKKFKTLNLSDLDQGQWMTLTFGSHKDSCTHIADCIYQLLYHRLQ